MKYRIILTLGLFLAIAGRIYGQDGSLDEVLRNVEANNITLQAARHSAQAGKLEARTGNSLDDLSVGYDHLWGREAALGKTGELTISQSFDFPTVYAQRRRIADSRAGQYDNQYLDLRQQVLLEAKELCIELWALAEREQLLNSRLQTDEYLQGVFSRRYDMGDATLLEKTKFDNEVMLLRESVAQCASRRVEVEKRLWLLNGGMDVAVDFENPMPREELRPYEEVLADYETFAPQLLSFRIQETVADEELKLSRRQAIPKFELGYKHEYGTADRERFNGVTVGLSVPIFSNRHNVQRAKAAHAAARLENEAAAVECRALLQEMYAKAGLQKGLLDRCDGLPGAEEFYGMLSRMLDAGQISVVEYFSESYSFNDVLEVYYRTLAEYKTLVARINMIYL